MDHESEINIYTIIHKYVIFIIFVHFNIIKHQQCISSYALKVKFLNSESAPTTAFPTIVSFTNLISC